KVVAMLVQCRASTAVLFWVLCTLAVSRCPERAHAQSAKQQAMREVVAATSEGTEFWVCFQKNGQETELGKRDARVAQRERLTQELFITSSENAKVRIEIDGLLFRQETRVRAGTVISVRIDTAAQLRSSEVVERLAVHITSDKPISVYGLSHRYQTTDSYMGLPIEALGTEYRIMSYYKLTEGLIAQFAVIATQDSTEVTITPKAPTLGGRQPDVPFTVQLSRGDVYQVIASAPRKNQPSDLTGTLVQSTKPIAVFSGHSGAYIPVREKGYNHLIEQLPPVPAWGRHYYIGKLFGRTKSTIRVLAAENDTRVFANGQLIALLAAGDYYEDSDLREHTLITADKRILVAQYSHGFENSLDSIGDPMMILLTPTQQFLKKYRMATPIRGEWKHFVNIVVPRTGLSSLRIDGKPADERAFTPFGESRYSIAQISLNFGTHTFECNEPFGLYSYGFGYGYDSYDAYGNMVGQSFLALRAIPDTLPPTVEIMYVNATPEPAKQLGQARRGNEALNTKEKRQISDTLSAEEQFDEILRRRALARLAVEEQDRQPRLLKPLVEAVGAGRIPKLIFRDDREIDRGLEYVQIRSTENLVLPQITPSSGAPVASVMLNEAEQITSGRALIEVRDVAGNTALYTLCFSKDPIGTDHMLALTAGETDYCPKRTLWYAGVFGTGGITANDAQLQQIRGISALQSIAAPGVFTHEPSASIRLLGAGLAIGYRIAQIVGVSARIAHEQFPAILRAPDRAPAGVVRNLDGSVAPLWLAQTLALQNAYISISLLGEVFLSANFYGILGLKSAIALTKTIDTRAVVVTPENFVLLDRPENAVRSFVGDLPVLNAVVPFVVGGAGLNIPLWRSIGLNVEALYSHALGSLVETGDWRLAQLALNLGVRVRL
ncbi:MAG: IgGFc-binding protein, partial [Bacteroidota bacterium]|nr:IgGFc-binding protein [Candidatus Kapabacteria bacterium]MDW8220507.1 IgGFc-binding protein [Bacteroidota bacterium]